MKLVRLSAIALALSLTGIAPVSAQIFWQAPDFTGLPLTGYEAGIGVPLPGATPAEQDAALSWTMRSALNVAALQCSFEPTLRTTENYNAMINDHGVELAAAFNTLNGYFKRTKKAAALAQKALDTYGTRTYSAYSTVRAQLGFCSTAGRVGRVALFTPKGKFLAMAKAQLRTLHNSLIAQGEQRFRFPAPVNLALIPIFDEQCFKGNRYIMSCGLRYGG